MDALPPQPSDAITAFAVPNPGSPFRGSRFFRVWPPGHGPSRSPGLLRTLADYVRQPVLSVNVIF